MKCRDNVKYIDRNDLYRIYYEDRDLNLDDEDRLDDLRMQEKEMEWANQFAKDNEGWGYNE